MERQAHSTYLRGMLPGDSDDDTVEVLTLRPHETYRKNRNASSQDLAHDSSTDIQDASR